MNLVSIKSLFEKFDLQIFEPVSWGGKIDCQLGGVYAISTSNNPNQNVKCLEHPEFDLRAIEAWQRSSPGLNFENVVDQSPESFAQELGKFWISQTSIAYIGQGNNLGTRISQFYRHKIGKTSPHAGGQWIKTLKNLNQLHIFYSPCDNYKETEFKMLIYFAECITGMPYWEIENIPKYLPFGNLEVNLRKEHPIKRSN